MKKEYYVISFRESELGWGMKNFDSDLLSFDQVAKHIKLDESEKSKNNKVPDYYIVIEEIFLVDSKGKKISEILNYFDYFKIKKVKK